MRQADSHSSLLVRLPSVPICRILKRLWTLTGTTVRVIPFNTEPKRNRHVA